ncbi:MAG: glycosyltransferase 87 family protein [Nitrososphaerota archaeon]|nr:glycosyltransferase 87 family protein [Candidatus Calditenuaceae archaeon]MDW8073730.1 glycosyltransferase 87 family protein [Nitrososphaerota archaeon]
MDKRTLETVVYVVSVISWIASGLIHFPQLGWSIYSDIVSFWYRPESGELLKTGAAPCFQFFFEYPPASCLSIFVSALLGSGDLVRYYQAFFYLSLPAYIAIAWSIIQISRISGSGWLGLVFIASPSLIVYGIYNFDHFAAAAAGLGVVFLLRKRYFISGLIAGFGFAIKLYTALLLPIALLETRGRDRIVYLLAYTLAAAPLYVLQEALNPNMLARFIEYHSGWGLENAWYIWIFQDQFSPTAKMLGTLLGAFLVIQVSFARGPILPRMLLAVSSWLVMSYIFTPQMVIWLLPFLPAVSRVALPFWPSLEISNVAIILTWFGDYNPVMPPSPPQIMALIRAASLAIIILSVYRNTFKKGQRSEGP